MNPRDIAEALYKAGVDRLSPPAVAYLGERMGRSDLAKRNLGGLRRISFGCAKRIGDAVPGADPEASRWAYYRVLDDGAHWLPGFKVASYNDKDALKITDARLRTKMADEPPNSVLVYRVWTDGTAASDPVVVVDNYEPGNRPEMARKLGIEGIGDVSLWNYYRAYVDDPAMGHVDVIYTNISDTKAADARIRITLQDEIAAGNAGGPCVFVYRRLLEHGAPVDGSHVQVVDTCPHLGRVPPGIGNGGEPFDPAIVRGAVDEFDTFADLDAAARALVSVAYRAAPRAWGEVGEAELATLGSYPIHRMKAGDLGASSDVIMPERDKWMYARESENGTTDMGPRASYPTGIPPELEQTMRALVADWEGFDRAGVGSKVLPEFKPQAVDFRKTRDAWKAGTLDQTTLDQTIQSAAQVASQVRDALVKSGVVDPGLGPAAVKAAQTAQAKPAASATSWMDQIPALKWLNDPKGPKVRVEADSIVPAEWRAPIVLGVSALALGGGYYVLTSRKRSRRTYASE